MLQAAYLTGHAGGESQQITTMHSTAWRCNLESRGWARDGVLSWDLGCIVHAAQRHLHNTLQR